MIPGFNRAAMCRDPINIINDEEFVISNGSSDAVSIFNISNPSFLEIFDHIRKDDELVISNGYLLIFLICILCTNYAYHKLIQTTDM